MAEKVVLLQSDIDAEERRLIEASKTTFGDLERVGVRTARILFGAGLAYAGHVISLGGHDISDTPFASLTINDVLGAAFRLACVAGCFWYAVVAAFGAGPSLQEKRDSVRRRAAQVVALRVQTHNLEQAKYERQVARAKAAYRHGKVIGMLFDPDLAKRRRWLPNVAVGIYFLLFMALIAYSAAHTH